MTINLPLSTALCIVGAFLAMNFRFKKYTTTGGHGVGLNFCKEAMRKMDGNITCTSLKDKGTEFIISFGFF